MALGIHAAERLIVALDQPHSPSRPDQMIDVRDALEIVDKLDGLVSFFKVGWPLYMADGGHAVARDLVRKGKRVFLDLKFGDIPETVKRLVRVAVDDGVSFLTLHANIQAVRAAVDVRGASELKVLMVTLLTSLDETDLEQLGIGRSVREYVRHWAERALEAGGDGVICSGREAGSVRSLAPARFLVVTPGIRPAGLQAEDHKRPATPGEAIAAGADYLVVGRPIVRAEDVRAVARQIISEMQEAFEARSG